MLPESITLLMCFLFWKSPLHVALAIGMTCFQDSSIMDLFLIIIVTSFHINLCLFAYLFQNCMCSRTDLPSGLSNNFAFLINDIFNHNGKIWQIIKSWKVAYNIPVHLSIGLRITFFVSHILLNLWLRCVKIVGGETKLNSLLIPKYFYFYWFYISIIIIFVWCISL